MPYFAKFVTINGVTFRLDTRIYLHDNPKTDGRGNCIAAIVGKNPGSATTQVLGKWGPLSLAGDKMLPSVRNRFRAGFQRAGVEIPLNAYVQVWNLFYLCDKNLTEALRSIRRIRTPRLCSSEKRVPPIIWFAWGPGHPQLDQMKARFRSIRRRKVFYFDQTLKEVVSGIPPDTVCAKHPQGLPTEPIVSHLASLLQ